MINNFSLYFMIFLIIIHLNNQNRASTTQKNSYESSQMYCIRVNLLNVFIFKTFQMFSFQPKAVFFTCMDSRMIPTRFTETHVGDMFVGK